MDEILKEINEKQNGLKQEIVLYLDALQNLELILNKNKEERETKTILTLAYLDLAIKELLILYKDEIQIVNQSFDETIEDNTKAALEITKYQRILSINDEINQLAYKFNDKKREEAVLKTSLLLDIEEEYKKYGINIEEIKDNLEKIEELQQADQQLLNRLEVLEAKKELVVKTLSVLEEKIVPFNDFKDSVESSLVKIINDYKVESLDEATLKEKSAELRIARRTAKYAKEHAKVDNNQEDFEFFSQYEEQISNKIIQVNRQLKMLDIVPMMREKLISDDITSYEQMKINLNDFYGETVDNPELNNIIFSLLNGSELQIMLSKYISKSNERVSELDVEILEIEQKLNIDATITEKETLYSKIKEKINQFSTKGAKNSIIKALDNFIFDYKEIEKKPVNIKGDSIDINNENLNVEKEENKTETFLKVVGVKPASKGLLSKTKEKISTFVKKFKIFETKEKNNSEKKHKGDGLLGSIINDYILEKTAHIDMRNFTFNNQAFKEPVMSLEGQTPSDENNVTESDKKTSTELLDEARATLEGIKNSSIVEETEIVDEKGAGGRTR